MSSLRVISISLRRLSLSLVLLLLPIALGAASFRAAVVADDERSLRMILDALSVLSGPVTSSSSIASYEAKAEREREAEKAERIIGYITAENLEALEAMEDEEESAAESDELILEVVSVTVSDAENEFLMKGDEEAFSYVMLSDDLDLLIVSKTEDDGLLSDHTLWVNGREAYSSLYLSSDDDEEFYSILSVLLPYLKSPDTIIVPVDIPAVVSLSIDGSPVTPLRSVIALEKGEHEIIYTSPRFERIEETVDVDESTVLSPHFVPLFSGPAFISSLPYDAAIYYQGMPVVNHVVEEGTVPFSIAARHDGFSPFSMQSTEISDTISISLRPEWMAENDTIERAKGRFYDSLIATLVTFGAFVATNSLSGIYTDVDLAPVAVAFTGLSLVQLVELMDAMFDYFQMARMGG